MVFCHKCGVELPDNVYFCPKCGVRTIKGEEEGISTIWEDMKDTFHKIGKEMEKALSLAASEMEKAFQTAKENIQESAKKEPAVCANCGEKIQGYARFCYKCGNKIDQV